MRASHVQGKQPHLQKAWFLEIWPCAGEKENSPKPTEWMEAWWMGFSFWLSIYHSWFPWECGWIRRPCYRRMKLWYEPFAVAWKASSISPQFSDKFHRATTCGMRHLHYKDSFCRPELRASSLMALHMSKAFYTLVIPQKDLNLDFFRKDSRFPKVGTSIRDYLSSWHFIGKWPSKRREVNIWLTILHSLDSLVQWDQRVWNGDMVKAKVEMGSNTACDRNVENHATEILRCQHQRVWQKQNQNPL